MSIPPLVCSTPPPPDQCEDDKDTEDYDLQYHLSQDDEDDNYDFGNYSSFNHFQSSQNKTDPIITMAPQSCIKDDSSKHKDSSENNVGTNVTSESKAETIEENHLEDLDLRLDHESLQKEDDSKNQIELKSGENILYETPKNDLKSPIELESAIQSDEFVELPSLDQMEEPPSYVDEIIAVIDNCDVTPTVPDLPLDFSEDVEPNEKLSIPESKEREKISLPMMGTEAVESETEVPKKDVDDFGDFDDFQFAAPIEKPATLDICVNPWENTNTTDDFGNFKASFDGSESNLFSANESATKHSTETNELEVLVENIESPSAEAVVDDEFGDFDDFKSASVEAKTSGDAEDDEEPTPQFSLLNLQGTDEQITQNINNVINTEFEDEIKEPTEEFDVKLDSVLGVTWGHLLAVDERQPYMVNWNNSLGQKTLLKALCIDSRNILFGPKWSYNMPKYAATLSAAPLQPQKQLTSPTQAEPSQDEAASKSGTWSDPFTSDGKESCKAETSSQNPVIEPGPTDLDVFEACTSSKPDKIFSSTLSIQPLRQISLPDTHIFTPTDSETPRSTTIHYDNSPRVLLPQTVIECKSDPNFKTEQTLSPRPSTSTADDDYWEFQDFKGPSTSNTTIPSASIASKQSDPLKANSNITSATQVLKPIKVEPSMPTLNWPDPGEVKETFDDFSDFVSSTTLSSQPTPIVSVSHIDNKPPPDLAEPSSSAAPKENERLSADASGDFDDDFDTFQSALPAISYASVPSVSGMSSTAGDYTKPGTSQAAPTSINNFEFAFPKVNNNIKAEPISFESMTKSKDALQAPTNFFSNNLEFKGPPLQTPSAPTATGLLQPTPVNSTATLQNQQKCSQILQPLSLESFSQINWPNPGIDLQDLSRFNPVETLQSLKSDLSVNSQSKVASPVHGRKSAASSQSADDDWGEFVSSKPKPQPQQAPKKSTAAAQAQAFTADDDEWTDFVSNTNVKPQNGLNTISFNVHTNTNLTIQKPNPGNFTKKSQLPLDIPTLNYITPKSTNHKAYNDRHLNL